VYTSFDPRKVAVGESQIEAGQFRQALVDWGFTDFQSEYSAAINPRQYFCMMGIEMYMQVLSNSITS
jgi:hypothetical protein